jgi:hypothetical protein
MEATLEETEETFRLEVFEGRTTEIPERFLSFWELRTVTRYALRPIAEASNLWSAYTAKKAHSLRRTTT